MVQRAQDHTQIWKMCVKIWLKLLKCWRIAFTNNYQDHQYMLCLNSRGIIIHFFFYTFNGNICGGGKNLYKWFGAPDLGQAYDLGNFFKNNPFKMNPSRTIG